MHHLAIERVLDFLTDDDPNLWKEDLQDLAAFAKTCKQTSEVLTPVVKTYAILETHFFPERIDYDKELDKFHEILKRQRLAREREARQQLVR